MEGMSIVQRDTTQETFSIPLISFAIRPTIYLNIPHQMNEYTSHLVTRCSGQDDICGILAMLIMIHEETTDLIVTEQRGV